MNREKNIRPSRNEDADRRWIWPGIANLLNFNIYGKMVRERDVKKNETKKNRETAKAYFFPIDLNNKVSTCAHTFHMHPPYLHNIHLKAFSTRQLIQKLISIPFHCISSCWTSYVCVCVCEWMFWANHLISGHTYIQV